MNTVEKLISALDEVQAEAHERSLEFEEDDTRRLYFNGKDVGLAEAKDVVRHHSDELNE